MSIHEFLSDARAEAEGRYRITPGLAHRPSVDAFVAGAGWLVEQLGWEYAAIPIDSVGDEWVERDEAEVDELIAAHANPDHYINAPHNADLAKVVGKKLIKRRPAGPWIPRDITPQYPTTKENP